MSGGEPLFQTDGPFFLVQYLDGACAVPIGEPQRVVECQRCGALVRKWAQHVAWHGVVDSNQTAYL